MLSFEVCNAARLRRDPIYDGHFFTAVKTTRIYCGLSGETAAD
jgi:AraC family transcriptional regulator, regulatory protein of adaptative response / methylated-DNA-[protein]-cysteine methyltransferase